MNTCVVLLCRVLHSRDLQVQQILQKKLAESNVHGRKSLLAGFLHDRIANLDPKNGTLIAKLMAYGIIKKSSAPRTYLKA